MSEEVLSVDDLVLVEVDEGVDYLQLIVLHFHFGKSLPPLDQLVQSLVGANFKQNVDVLVVFEDVFELYDILMAQRFVDFDLGDELNRKMGTFCLARERFKELLAMILAAEMRFVSRLVIS